MALTDHSKRSSATPDLRRIGLLIVGDIVAFHVITTVGLLSHGELSGIGAVPEVVEIAAPFAIGWFAVAPFAGAFKAELTDQPRHMLGRTALAWLIACPIGLLLWSLVRQKSIQPAFATVTLITNMIVLLGWRGIFALLAARRGGD
jgi:DUF3054 family protein